MAAEVSIVTGRGKDSLYHTWALRWAEQHAGNLIERISDTTRTKIRAAVAEWIESGASTSSLRDAIRETGQFSLARAKMIAITEGTYAFTEGTFDLYENVGLAQRPAERPPAHPGCRCLVAVNEEAGQLNYIWITVNDDNVCPICEPKHLEVMGAAGSVGTRSLWNQ